MSSVSLCEVRMDLGAVAGWSGLRQRSGELGLGGTEVWGVVLVELATEAAYINGWRFLQVGIRQESS